jgi:23S rRNA maturation mini-RNase III
MQNVDELCIKYLMNELDPSERILVEKKMREDPNILIEIESLRCTLQKLDALPYEDPPEHITENIMNIARERQASRTRPIPLLNSFGSNARYWGAAAAIVLSFSVGTYFLFNNSTQTVNVNMPEKTEVSAKQQASSKSVIQPWIDHNNILYIQANNTSGTQTASSMTDTVFMKSMKKLRPLNGTVINADKPLDLQLAREKQE